MPKRPLSIMIRDAMLEHGSISAYDFWKLYVPDIKYATVRRYFHFLRKLGLIHKVGEEPSSRGGWSKALYSVAPGMEDDPRWFNPQQTLYPETRLGARRYRRLKESGL